MTRRLVLIVTVAAAVVTFAAVQDRVTAEGARRYVALQRAAAAGIGPPVSKDEVVGPAVRRSVAQGCLWGGIVLAAGVGAAMMVGRGAARD